jgi:hypothetical protein
MNSSVFSAQNRLVLLAQAVATTLLPQAKPAVRSPERDAVPA